MSHILENLPVNWSKLKAKFSWNFNSGRKTKFFMIGTILFCFIMIAVTIFTKPIFVNMSASAPQGVYLAIPFSSYNYGDFIIVSCPKDYPPVAQKDMNLLKTVRGFPGDTYTITDKDIQISGKSFPIYHSAKLPSLPTGTFIVDEETVLCLNDSEISFDSRYIGPIPVENIKNKVILLLDFDKIQHFIYSIFYE